MNVRLVSSCVSVAVLAWTSTACGVLQRTDDDIADKTIRYQIGHLTTVDDSNAQTALSITYSTPDGMQEQHDVDLPWTKVVGAARRGFTPSVSAQLDGYGTIECRIVADNSVVEQKTSMQDPYPVVECSA